ncbi:MAG: SMC-Scp complex subunit ScpB [Methylomonas sp.]|nr:SMC-Scp complex subunit ScpB [Methylomonas sp.]
MTIKRIVEALLFAANKPMTIKQIQEAFPELEQPDTLEIQLALEAIAQDYISRPIGLKQLASGYRFQVREAMAPWVTRLFEEKPPRYSRALLETLAIIAYRQPVTRGEIEDIRGVGVSSGIIHTLLEREWIRVIAHKEVPGRPALYGTTKQFLDYFNLTSLNEMPALEEISDLDFGAENTPQDHREKPQTESPETEVTAETAATQVESGPQAAIDDGHGENRTLH